MNIVSLRLIDTSDLDASDLEVDNDTWIESCLQCGTLDNSGDQLCLHCDDLAA